MLKKFELLAYLHYHFLLKILLRTTTVAKAAIVAIHTGTIIEVGLTESNEVLTAITVVGITCKEAVFITINVAIEFDNFSLLGFFSCIVSIAFNPKGVAAFPKPKILATIFIEISLYSLSCLLISGNKNIITGDKNLVNFSIREVALAISIIPFHRHNVPKKVNIKLTVLSADSKIAELTSSTLPTKNAYTIETIIKTGQIIFNNLQTPKSNSVNS